MEHESPISESACAAPSASQQSGRDRLEKTLAALGLTPLEFPTNRHSMLQAITEVLKFQSNTSVTEEELLMKIRSEVLENFGHYQQFVKYAADAGSMQGKITSALNAYAEQGRQDGDFVGDVLIPALCNAACLTIVVCDYSDQDGFQMIINTPSRVKPRDNIYILRSISSQVECYEGLFQKSYASNVQAANEELLKSLKLQQLQEDSSVEDAPEIHSPAENEDMECDDVIENEMKAQGIQLDRDTSLEVIAQSIAKLPKLEMHKSYSYITYCTRRLNAWKKVKVNIGVIGTTGTGKSSFVNAIRGVDADDEDGAEVDSVGECTKCVKDYTFKKNKNIVIWDLPGVGTERFEQNHYLKIIEVDKYDAFAIISNERFTETDTWLANEIAARKKAFYFVRTKIHANVDSDKKAHKKMHNTLKLVEDIRQRTEKHIASLGLKTPVYLIDNYEPELYDFDKLKSDITTNLPLAVQQQAMYFSLNAIGNKMISGKVKELRDRIKVQQICIQTLLPFSSLLTLVFVRLMMLKIIIFCYQQLGLDDESLRTQANELGLKDDAALRKIRHQHFQRDEKIQIAKLEEATNKWCHVGNQLSLERKEFSDWYSDIVDTFDPIAKPEQIMNQALNEMERAAYALSVYRHETFSSSVG